MFLSQQAVVLTSMPVGAFTECEMDILDALRIDGLTIVELRAEVDHGMVWKHAVEDFVASLNDLIAAGYVVQEGTQFYL